MLPGHDLQHREGLPPMPQVQKANGEFRLELLRRNPGVRSNRRAKAANAESRREVVMLYGQLDVHASVGEVQMAYDLYCRIRQLDPDFETPGLTFPMLWHSLVKAEAYHSSRRQRQLNEDVFRKLLEVETAAPETLLRFWHEVHGEDVTQGDPYLTLALKTLQAPRPKLELFRRYLEMSLLVPGDDRQRFQVVLKALAAVDSRLLSSEEVWDIFQRLVLSSDTPLEEGFRLLIEAFDDEHWLTMARLSGCQLEEFLYPTSEVRTVEEAPSEKAPRARIRNLTQHLMDLKLLAPVPSADRSAEVLREPFRFLRKSKRQAAAAERRRELPRAMASAVKSGTSGGASSPLTSANDYEAAIAERLATMKPNFGPVRILLQQAMGKGLKLSLNTWASVMSSFASRGVEGLSTVEKLQKLFRASGPVLMEREDFHRAMQLAAEAGDLEHVADLFNDMVCKGFEAQEDSYTLVFKACRRHGLDFSTKSFAEKYFYAMMSMGIEPKASTLSEMDKVVCGPG